MLRRSSVPAHYEICGQCKHFQPWIKESKNGAYTVCVCDAVPFRDKNDKSNDGKRKIGFLMGSFKKGQVVPFRPCYNDVPQECPYILEQIVKDRNK